jgi:hypothetical protein
MSYRMLYLAALVVSYGAPLAIIPELLAMPLLPPMFLWGLMMQVLPLCVILALIWPTFFVLDRLPWLISAVTLAPACLFMGFEGEVELVDAGAGRQPPHPGLQPPHQLRWLLLRVLPRRLRRRLDAAHRAQGPAAAPGAHRGGRGPRSCASWPQPTLFVLVESMHHDRQVFGQPGDWVGLEDVRVVVAGAEDLPMPSMRVGRKGLRVLRTRLRSAWHFFLAPRAWRLGRDPQQASGASMPTVVLAADDGQVLGARHALAVWEGSVPMLVRRWLGR